MCSLLRYSLLFAAAAAMFAQDRVIDVERSSITIHVGKTGLFSAAGHDHWVTAPIAAGTFSATGNLHVEFKVLSAKMAVKPDSKVDSKTQGEIQKDMEEKTLEISRYPEITFKSTRVQGAAEGEWKVDGDLSLHGTSKPVTLTVKRQGDAYVGHAVIKQTDFGIKPVSVGGGVVKVKNELEIDFQILARPA